MSRQAIEAMADMARKRIKELREQSAALGMVELAKGTARLVTPELFRVRAKRGTRSNTRWRYGINRVAAFKQFLAAGIYASVAAGKP